MNLRFIIAIIVLLLAAWPVQADDSRRSGEGSNQEVRGLFLLKIPFGQDYTFERPTFGVDLDVRSDLQRRHKRDRYDPKTGQRKPYQDPDKVRTWPLEGPILELQRDS